MFGANRKRGVDFLLVRNSNFGPIFHRDLIGFICPYSTLIFGVFPLHQIAHVGLKTGVYSRDVPDFGSGSRKSGIRPFFGKKEALNYSAVKLFSKNSNLCVADT